jgi:DNA-nicking Smr family endonuclease
VKDEDRDLFRKAMHGVRQISQDRHHLKKPPRSAGTLANTSSARPLGDFYPMDGIEPVAGHQTLAWFAPGVSARQQADLRRGRMGVDATLDLHGMTVREADHAMTVRIEHMRAKGQRVLQVIHGKGHPQRGSVLKGWLTRALVCRPDILGFCSCPQGAGGTGALYLWLKKA